jgi:predicted nucleotidyltransferase component of viral defense system
MRDYAESVRARLTKIAQQQDIRFNLLVLRYLHERFLFRLSQSQYAENFCLKGGTLFYALEGMSARSTKDLDLLGQQIGNQPEKLILVFKGICSALFEEDGVFFDISTMQASEIVKDGDYRGTRIELTVRLGQIRERLQIDAVVPRPVLMVYPTILDMPAPLIYCYSVETIIAEKFHAMISRGEINSRMKDFYDVYRLLPPGKHNSETLEQSIRATFAARQTPYVKNHVLFSNQFASDISRLTQWKSFLNKSKLEALDFTEVHRLIVEKLKPIFEKI